MHAVNIFCLLAYYTSILFIHVHVIFTFGPLLLRFVREKSISYKFLLHTKGGIIGHLAKIQGLKGLEQKPHLTVVLPSVD